jgi:hypothetical protein
VELAIKEDKEETLTMKRRKKRKNINMITVMNMFMEKIAITNIMVNILKQRRRRRRMQILET